MLRPCAQCGLDSFGETTTITLRRYGFHAKYHLAVCWHCFEVYRTMAHTSAHSWRRLPDNEQLKLRVAATG